MHINFINFRVTQGFILNLLVLVAVVMLPQNAKALDFYGGPVEVNSSKDSFGGYFFGVNRSFSIVPQKIDLGLRIEYFNKGFRGDFNFFNVSTGEYLFQGTGEATIQYLQPSLEIRGTLFSSVVHPVFYVGVGTALWLSDDFVPLNPTTSLGGGLSTQSPTGVGFIGATLYAKQFLLDARYTRGLTSTKSFLQQETVQLGIGITFNFSVGNSSEVR